ncbi:protein PLASTID TRANSCRIPTIONALLY ACTIVE [Trifolium repens]|nr:protein PLASTID TRANSCRIPTIONALLY ACTIVE [Trifolium repens]
MEEVCWRTNACKKKGLLITQLQPVKAAFVEAAQFPFLQPPKVDDSTPEFEPLDPDFYRIGFVQSMRAYGVDFKEGPNGFGVHASKDVEPLEEILCSRHMPLEET